MIYTLLFLPLFMGLKSPQGQRLTDRIGRWAGLSGLIFGFGLLQFVVEVTLRDAWEPTNNLTHDWYNHALYAGFFCGWV
ncbi:MAG: hypothetical protein HC880_10290, partial [Bacteroidia bacterium]|nr:hypothetical protein [Bacteroidia bacterium]